MTAAYKRKLEEEKQWLAEEKLREAQEQKNDVVKKGHMADFYRYSLPNRPEHGCVGLSWTLCIPNVICSFDRPSTASCLCFCALRSLCNGEVV